MKDEKSIVFIWQCFPQDLIWDYTMHQDQFERNVFEYYCGWVALALHLLMLMLHKQIHIYNCILNIIISATLDKVSWWFIFTLNFGLRNKQLSISCQHLSCTLLVYVKQILRAYINRTIGISCGNLSCRPTGLIKWQSFSVDEL